MTAHTWKTGAKMNLFYLWLEGGGVDSGVLVLHFGMISGIEKDVDLLYEKLISVLCKDPL